MGYHKNLKRFRNGTAIVLSFAVFSAFPFAQSAGNASAQERAGAIDSPSLSLIQDRGQELSMAEAVSTANGVALQWHTTFELNTLGFNIYRVQNGQSTRANDSIIPASVFMVGAGKPVPGGASYRWVDRQGTVDAIYYIEVEGLDGNRRSYEKIINVSRGRPGETQQQAVSGSSTVSPGLKEYPAALTASEAVQSSPGNQWVVAGRSALKIQIDHDGWYRVTQPQMSSAGFNPVVDIRNLSVFADGLEIAIKTSKASGTLTTGDYLEFYGRGMDTPDTNSRIYYLIAGTQPGKRSPGEAQKVTSPIVASNQPIESPGLSSSYKGWFAPLVNLANGQTASAPLEAATIPVVEARRPTSVDNSATPPPAAPALEPPVSNGREEGGREEARKPQPAEATKTEAAAPSVVPMSPTVSAHQSRTITRSRRKKLRRRAARRTKVRYAHAASETTALALTFDYTIQLKERYKDSPPGFIPVYFTQALNGEAENWFGKVISSVAPVETVPLHKIDLSAGVPARLVVALQGVSGTNPVHQVNVSVNNTVVGTVSFFGNEHVVQTFIVPASQLLEGNNSIKFDHGFGNDTSIVDYLTLTYQHTYQAFNDSLRFTARLAQTLQVDGFSTPNVQLLDISDPTAVRVTQLVGTASGLGYAITVPPAGPRKGQRPRIGPPESQVPRLMYALPQGQFETPAGFSLNQPSTLNQPSAQDASNSADLLILSYKDFIPSLQPLVNRRMSEGLTVKVVDIEDVYDEFSYGAHDHHAIKDLLLRATAVWTKAPRYLLLAGDASEDPRNYEGFAGGGGDLVPTNLVDTLFGEACSDDILADFDGDGIAEIPVGRLPAASVTEANQMVSKIVNFSKATVPQTALLVADDNQDPPYYFDFRIASDQIAALLPASLTIQKVYRSAQGPFGDPVFPTCTARANMINAMNQGVALVNYSGHGNVNVWAGSCTGNPSVPFFQSPDAHGLTNGTNHLPLVIVANCLNGQFNIPPLESLAEGFIKNPNGGGVAVYASSGETIPDGQQQMNIKLYQTLFGAQSMALGDVTKLAKAATNDMDVRHTWILLGDPSMKIW